jgi:hypothetical protein
MKQPQTIDIQTNILELLALTHIRPLQDIFAGGGGNNLSGNCYSEIFNLLETSGTNIDWTSCCLAMKQEPSFEPNWLLSVEGIATHLYFLEREDVFLMIDVDEKGKLIKVGLVEKDKSSTILERRKSAIQKFSNFLLHFIWHNL